MRLAKYVKKPCFLPIFDKKRCFLPKSPYIGSDPPYIRRSKIHEKRWWGIRVFQVFFPKIPVYGIPKTTKIRDFWSVCLPPPKIIKNRLNFAPSKKFKKNAVFIPSQITDFHEYDDFPIIIEFRVKLCNYADISKFLRFI